MGIAMKVRFFKGDIVCHAGSSKTYKVEEVYHDRTGKRVIIAFPEDKEGIGVKFYDDDRTYYLKR